MLIDNFKFVKRAKFIVSSRVRGNALEYVNNWLSGGAYLHFIDSFYKSVRVPGEWELNSFWLREVVPRNERPDEMIKGATEVVQSVADNEAKAIRDGFIVVDSEFREGRFRDYL